MDENHNDDNRGRFPAGKSGNPTGRPKGARSKLGEDFLADMYADWQNHGPAVIERVRETKPEQYLKVVASLLPKDINLNVESYQEWTDEQLMARILDLNKQIGFAPLADKKH